MKKFNNPGIICKDKHPYTPNGTTEKCEVCGHQGYWHKHMNGKSICFACGVEIQEWREGDRWRSATVEGIFRELESNLGKNSAVSIIATILTKGEKEFQMPSGDKKKYAWRCTRDDNTVKMVEIRLLKPFRFQNYNYPWDQVIFQYKRGELIIPDYQRDYVWTPEQKVKLIDSLIIGMPVGSIYLNKTSHMNPLEVVDGQQRIKTVMEFLDGKFSYKGFNCVENPHFKDFFALILMRTIIPTKIVEYTNRKDVVEFYKRLNYEGTPHTVEELLKLDSGGTE